MKSQSEPPGPIDIREMIESDCAIISRAFAEQGWDKPPSKYLKYLKENAEARRLVLVAEYDQQFAGYLTILWQSDYPPFCEAHIPEIVDFNVLIKYQRKGIGTALLDAAEEKIASRSRIAGIGVGLTPDYGAAQALYIKRGYIPDGRGMFCSGKFLQYGEQITVGDDLTLYLTKALASHSS